MSARYKGWARLFAPFISGEAQRQLEADMQRMKEVVVAEDGEWKVDEN